MIRIEPKREDPSRKVGIAFGPVRAAIGRPEESEPV